MLSKRLRAVADLVPQGVRMADIGCDHAYLPIALLKEGRVTQAIGCDINQGPLEAARLNAARAGLDASRLTLRLGDGLTALTPGEVEVVTLAGMGGGLMVEILSAAPAVVQALSRIVVSPNVAPWLLRRWAADNGWRIEQESVVADGGHYYEVFALVPVREAVPYSAAALYFGVSLPTQCDAVTTAYFAERWDKDASLLAIWEPLAKQRPEIAEKAGTLRALWEEWRRMRPCE